MKRPCCKTRAFFFGFFYMIKLSTTRETQQFAIVARRSATDVELILTNRMTKDVTSITATATELNGIMTISAQFDASEGQEFDMIVNDATGVIHRCFVIFTDQEEFSPAQDYVSEQSDENTFIIYE